MDNIINWGKVAFGSACGVLTIVFGAFDLAMQVLIVFTLFDCITGVVKAITTKELSSSVGAKGFAKKIGIMAIVAVAYQLDVITQASGWIRNTAVYFYIYNESISILENVGQMGVPLPEQLITMLKQIKNKSENGGDGK